MEPPAPLRILLIGSGGREHAFAWKLSQSPLVEAIFVTPGNGGTCAGGMDGKVTNAGIAADNTDNFAALIAFARAHRVNLVVPGPEAPLVAGVTDACHAAGLRCFGPSKATSRLEGSKSFAKEFMKRHNIPTARYERFTDAQQAKRWIRNVDFPVVIKADGLAAGKGVVIPKEQDESDRTLDDFLSGNAFGDAGREVVVEEYLEGDELSIISFVDGYTSRTLPAAQDHKRINDGDEGPMTGGMGCYAPTPIATPDLVDKIHRDILQPTISGMRHDRFPMVGILFTGLMITKDGPRVLEYNVRGGDPETECLLPLLDSDLAELMLACTGGYLDAIPLKISPKHSATVIAVAGGYPGSYAKNKAITFNEESKEAMLFHAGTKMDPSGAVVTNGGRVIACTATGSTLREAIDASYRGVHTFSFQDMFFRKDIGHRALKASTAIEKNNQTDSLSYADAGVSIDTGNLLVKQIAPLVKATARPGADASIGGFGGLVDLAAAGYNAPPKLVMGTDGVGTKLNIAQALGKHDTVGIDCVAMSVNDLVVQGAEVLSFVDTYTCGKLDANIATDFVRGVAAGCQQSNCALVGGETAEMPGMFTDGDLTKARGDVYDAVGTAVGAIPTGMPVLPRKDAMRAGDILLGIASSGAHSNGFSLIRKILERANLSVHDPAPWAAETTVGLSLLTPTRIYVRSLLPAIHEGLLLGMAHITGGGLIENVPRMLPKHLAAEFDATRWSVPPVLKWLQQSGKLSDKEFATTFNAGLGMVCVVKEADSVKAIQGLVEAGETVWDVGRLVERNTDGEGCVIHHCEKAWHGNST